MSTKEVKTGGTVCN